MACAMSQALSFAAPWTTQQGWRRAQRASAKLSVCAQTIVLAFQSSLQHTLLKYRFSTADSCSSKPFTPDSAMLRVKPASLSCCAAEATSERRAAESMVISTGEICFCRDELVGLLKRQVSNVERRGRCTYAGWVSRWVPYCVGQCRCCPVTPVMTRTTRRARSGHTRVQWV